MEKEMTATEIDTAKATAKAAYDELEVDYDEAKSALDEAKSALDEAKSAPDNAEVSFRIRMITYWLT